MTNAITPPNYVTTLKLDFDGTERAYRKSIKRIKAVLHIIGIIKFVDVKIMQTRKGFHTYLYIKSPHFIIKPMDIVTLQSLMGSDWKREAFNFTRVVSSMSRGELINEAWNVLFESKWKTKLGVGKPLSEETERPDLVKPFFTKK